MVEIIILCSRLSESMMSTVGRKFSFVEAATTAEHVEHVELLGHSVRKWVTVSGLPQVLLLGGSRFGQPTALTNAHSSGVCLLSSASNITVSAHRDSPPHTGHEVYCTLSQTRDIKGSHVYSVTILLYRMCTSFLTQIHACKTLRIILLRLSEDKTDWVVGVAQYM